MIHAPRLRNWSMHKLIPVASSARLTHARRPCSLYRRLSLGINSAIAFAIILVIGLPALSRTATTPRPCDIYGSAGTPCVAAHSTTRALYAAYDGPLYQVRRSSDHTTQDIGLLSAGGYANAAKQDSLCSGTRCVITKIYDQSPQHNDLGVANDDNPAVANALPITIAGHNVYGVFIDAGMGYDKRDATGTATGSQPEGMYMVTSANGLNQGYCCFDYGNAERTQADTGNGHMDAIYFGFSCWGYRCYGSGPWIRADLENGLFASDRGDSQNTADTGVTYDYVTAMLKNDGVNYWARKTGDAQSGGLTTWFAGPLPSVNGGGYSPMSKEGGIILGTGGDNSKANSGHFFEGVITFGLPTDVADNAVQANIVNVRYSDPTANRGNLRPGSEISLRATTACCTDYFLRHQFNGRSNTAILSRISSGSAPLDKEDATWMVRRGLANNSCLSLESKNHRGDYLRHFNFKLILEPYDGSAQFAADSTFCPVRGMNGQGISLRSLNYPNKYIRHYYFEEFIASEGGPNPWDTAVLWRDDVSWIVSLPWPP
jgi:hypothetical protein